MKKENSILNLNKSLYAKLFKINDSPQKISLGLGLGVFSGIIPGTGPLAALFLAMLLRVNRAAALLGSLITNTWLSVITFFLSIKVGSAIMGSDRQQAYDDWLFFIKNFNWPALFKMSIIKIVLPVLVGYFIVALALGLVVYLFTLTIFKISARRSRK